MITPKKIYLDSSSTEITFLTNGSGHLTVKRLVWTPDSARAEFERSSDFFRNENLFIFYQSAQLLAAEEGCWNLENFSL